MLASFSTSSFDNLLPFPPRPGLSHATCPRDPSLPLARRATAPACPAPTWLRSHSKAISAPWKARAPPSTRTLLPATPHSELCYFLAGEVPAIKAILVVDADGKRILARYYSADWASAADETNFEKKLYDKTMRTNAKNEGGHQRPGDGRHDQPQRSRRCRCQPAHVPLVHARRAAEVIMFDNLVTVYRNSADVWFYVVGSQCDVRVQTCHDQRPAAVAGHRWPPASAG